MNKIDEIYVAEYNPAKKQVHIELKSEKYRKAQRYILRNAYDNGALNEPLWIPFFEGTYDECSDACDSILLKKKNMTDKEYLDIPSVIVDIDR